MKKHASATFLWALIGSALLGAMASGTAHAAGRNTATATGASNATIIAPITLVHYTGYVLNFGTFTANSGTVTVSASTGAGSVTGAVTFTTASTTSYDAFLVTAPTNRNMNITTGPGTVTMGSNSMSFTTTPFPTAGYIAGTATSATAYFTVGGTLTVSAGQAGGSYTGSYPATVTYQ